MFSKLLDSRRSALCCAAVLSALASSLAAASPAAPSAAGAFPVSVESQVTSDPAWPGMFKVILSYQGAPGTHFCAVQAAFHRRQNWPARQFNSRRCFDLDRGGAAHDSVVAAAESDNHSLLLSTVILDDDTTLTHVTKLSKR